MNWLDKLERKFGRYAIHNLMYYIIILYAVGFVFQMINPSFYYNYLRDRSYHCLPADRAFPAIRNQLSESVAVFCICSDVSRT